MAGSRLHLKDLTALEGLQTLSLSNTNVTDAGLKDLTVLKELKELNLAETKVTDVGLKDLAVLKGLRKLDLYKTDVTDTGIARLQKAPPEAARLTRLLQDIESAANELQEQRVN
jgi:internalin A